MAAEAELSAADRIRDAALQGFADRGFAATSIRSVAAAAGVSPGLVQHHFPTKEALRDAVHAHVLAQAAATMSDLPVDSSPGDFAEEMGRRITAVVRDNPVALRYLARGIADRDAAALELFDGFVALTGAVVEQDAAAGRLRPDADRAWARLHVLVYNLGVVLLEAAIDRHLPEPLRSEEGLERWRGAATSMFRQGLYVPEESQV